MKPYITRGYQEGDEDQILVLMRDVFGVERSIEHWKWEFTPRPMCRVAQDDKIVGHQTVFPFQLKIGDQMISAAGSVDTMVHPEYQHQGIFYRLVTECNREAWNMGIKLILAWPNNQSRHGFLKLGWKKVINIPLLRRFATDGQPDTNIFPIFRFSKAYDELWAKANFPVAVVRDSTYLNWRYIDHPTYKYDCISLWDDLGELQGYAVFRIDDSGKGQIADILGLTDEAITTLADQASLQMQAAGAGQIWCFMVDRRYWKAMQKAHFSLKHHTNFLFAVLDHNLNEPVIYDWKNWHISFGDSDGI